MTPFEQARAALQRATSSERSPFYRNFYASAGFDVHHLPNNIAEWDRVPLLSKEDIVRVPVMERLFMPLSDVGMIRFTSGTTGKGILVLPRRISGEPPPAGQPRFHGTVLMSFYYYLYTFAHSRGNNPPRVISGDRANLPASASLAAHAGVDTLFGPASALISFAPYLRSHAADTRVRNLIFTAERPSLLQQEALHECYPAATIANLYALQETGEIAYTPAGATDTVLVAALPDHYLEIMFGEHTSPLDSITVTIEGELVVTSLYTAALPLIRYRTGDIVRATPRNGVILLEVLNREVGNQIRIPGGELLLAEFDRAIAKALPKLIADFECVVEEEKRGSTIVTSMTLILYQAADTPLPNDAAERISRELRVSERRTYADGVARGLYAPLRCICAPLETSESKRKHLQDRR